MDSSEASVPRISVFELAATLVCLAIWVHESSKPGGSLLGFACGMGIIALGFPWFLRSLEFVRSVTALCAGIALFFSAILISVAGIVYLRDASLEELIVLSAAVILVLLFGFPPVCAAIGLCAEAVRLGVKAGRERSFSLLRRGCQRLFSWIAWPAAIFLMGYMDLVPAALTARVRLSEPALTELVEQAKAGMPGKTRVQDKAGLVAIESVILEEDRVCLVTDSSGDLPLAGLLYSTGACEDCEQWRTVHLFGPWWQWRHHDLKYREPLRPLLNLLAGLAQRARAGA